MTDVKMGGLKNAPWAYLELIIKYELNKLLNVYCVLLKLKHNQQLEVSLINNSATRNDLTSNLTVCQLIRIIFGTIVLKYKNLSFLQSLLFYSVKAATHARLCSRANITERHKISILTFARLHVHAPITVQFNDLPVGYACMAKTMPNLACMASITIRSDHA